MQESVTHVSFEAYEHAHREKGADWFWILGMVTLALCTAAILLGNTLFGILILLTGLVMGIVSSRHPRVIAYEISTRGIRIGDLLYPYSTLQSFYIDEQNMSEPQLLLRSEKLLAPLLTIPLPLEYVNEVETLVASRIPEEFLEEPIMHKIFEFFGF